MHRTAFATMKKHIRATAVQFDCSKNKKESVKRLLQLVGEKAPHADLLLLAETVFAPYTTCRDFAKVAETIPGPFSRALAKIARQHRTYICSGLVEREGDKLFNTAILIGPDGRIITKYRKTALASVDIKHFQPGSGPQVVETELGRIGLLICRDTQDLGLISAMASQAPELILVPSYGLAKADYSIRQEIDCMVDECIEEWRLRMQTLAKICHSFVLRADHVGTEDRQVRVGHSIAVSPGGYVIAEATMQPACLEVILKADAPDQRHW
jgi:predicted amidohydrolase